MSIDAQIPNGFWPKVRWFMTYGASWMLPLVAIERFADDHPLAGTILAILTALDWGAVTAWDPIAARISAIYSRFFGAKTQEKDAFAAGLYVGQMQAGTGHLANNQTIEISARCFNATGHELFVHKLTGAIKVAKSADGSSKDICDLPPLRLMPSAPTERIKTKEFLLVFEQHVPHEVAAQILSMDTSYSIHFDFGNVELTIASYASHRLFARLPLWDGIRLFRTDQNYVHTGRVITARMEPIHISVKTGFGS